LRDATFEEVYDYWRGEGRRERVNISPDELESLPASGSDPEAAYAVKERQALVLQAISELDEDERCL